ncbi:MAG: sulfotransferase [Chloroflexi bacterium]|nr:sulfotransferase [Chloroflexota bacterium]
MSRLLIHIGYHKTGTSWLQRRLFVNTDLGWTLSHAKTAVVDPLILPHALDFDAAVCRAVFEPGLAAAWTNNLVPVISHERISGEVHIGGRDAKDIAERLYAIFPEAQILIVIREQQAMIRSIYGQFIKGTGVWSLRDYLDPPVPTRTRFKYGHFHPDDFRYHRLIACYQQLFGPAQVTVLPYELFRARPADFVAQIMAAVGLHAEAAVMAALPYGEQVNPSLSALGIAFKLRLNRLAGQRTPFNPTPLYTGRGSGHTRLLQALAFRVDRRLPATWKRAADEQMKHQIAERVSGYYAESNHLTAKLTGLNLVEWGYEL